MAAKARPDTPDRKQQSNEEAAMTDANKLAQTLAERGSRYGDFTDHARICQNLKRTMCAEAGWERLNDVQKQSLEVIADKVGRILSGDPNYADNWHDIQGYAKLAEDRLPSDFGQQNTIDCRTKEERADDTGRQLADGVRRAASGAVCNDPRTVEGVDVSFPTEKHMNFAPEQEESVWAEWEGGPMPVLWSVLVDVRQRNGDEFLEVEAEECCWGHSETGDEGGDIVAYRLSAEASHA